MTSNFQKTSQSSFSRVNDDEFYRNHFWVKLQDELGTFLPEHVRNILKFNYFDSPSYFKHITEDTFSELERFVRHNMKDLIEENDPDMRKYYGQYWKHPEKFSFTVGEKVILREMVKFVKNSDSRLWRCSDSIGNQQVTSERNQLAEKTVDAEAEEIRIKSLVSTVVNDLAVTFEPGVLQKLQEKMEVEIHYIKDLDKYEAAIKCPTCEFVLKISKKVDCKARWKISNLKRHFKRHSFITNSRQSKESSQDPRQAENDAQHMEMAFVEEMVFPAKRVKQEEISESHSI